MHCGPWRAKHSIPCGGTDDAVISASIEIFFLA
jgi:hypothetical protein